MYVPKEDALFNGNNTAFMMNTDAHYTGAFHARRTERFLLRFGRKY